MLMQNIFLKENPFTVLINSMTLKGLSKKSSKLYFFGYEALLKNIDEHDALLKNSECLGEFSTQQLYRILDTEDFSGAVKAVNLEEASMLPPSAFMHYKKQYRPVSGKVYSLSTSKLWEIDSRLDKSAKHMFERELVTLEGFTEGKVWFYYLRQKVLEN